MGKFFKTAAKVIHLPANLRSANVLAKRKARDAAQTKDTAEFLMRRSMHPQGAKITEAEQPVIDRYLKSVIRSYTKK